MAYLYSFNGPFADNSPVLNSVVMRGSLPVSLPDSKRRRSAFFESSLFQPSASKVDSLTSSDILSEEKSPRFQRLEGIAEALGCTVSDLFRTPEKSWFALVMTVSFKNLGFRSDAPVSVVTLKHRPEHIPEIVDNHRIFNAYHMNKKHWITVILSDNMDFDLLRELTEESYRLVTGKRG